MPASTDRPRYSISRYSKSRGNSCACHQCGEIIASTFILVERKPTSLLCGGAPELMGIAYWCERCMVKLAIEMLEYANV